jgi:thioesterase domain-containing protein
MAVETAQKLAMDGQYVQARWVLDFARQWRPEMMTKEGFQRLERQHRKGIAPRLHTRRYDAKAQEEAVSDGLDATREQIYRDMIRRRREFLRKGKRRE